MDFNYFELFSLPVTFIIDKASLKKRFYQMSREFHPDYHTLASEDQQTVVTEKYAMINKAFNVLSDDFSRRQYILETTGLLTGSDDKLPPSFLMEMMDLNEEIESLLTSGSENATFRAHEVIFHYDKVLEDEMATFELYSDKVAHSDIGVLNKIKECHLKTRYLLRIREKVANIAAP
jgi:molecular chaperone HscB